MGQLAEEVHKREACKLPTYPTLNPKHKPDGPEHVNMVTPLRNGNKADNVKSDSELVNDLLKDFPKPLTQNPKAIKSPKVGEGVDFFVMDTESPYKDVQPNIILGRPFLATIYARINCQTGAMDIAFGNRKLRLNVFNSLNSPILNDCYHIDTIDECIQTHTLSMNLDRTLKNLYYVDIEKELFDGMMFHEKEEEFQMIEKEFLLSLEGTPLQSQQVQKPTFNEVQEYVDCLLVHQDVLLWTRGSNKEKTNRMERVPETYDYRSQYNAYEYDTYRANYYIEMEDDTIYRGELGDQYFHPSSYETPSFFNQPQRPTQKYYCQGQKQGDNQHFSFDKKYDKLMSMIESNKEENQRYEASFAAHDASFISLETHVDRLLDQLNKDETYEPQGITVLDFDNEDEEQNEEFSLHSTNTIEYLTFGSCNDKEDVDDHNTSFEDLISPIKEHDKESVPFKVGEEVIEANTTPYLPTLEEPILSSIDDIRSKEDEEFLALLLYKYQCSNLLDEAEVTHIQNLPQFPRVVINHVGVDDLVFENEKEQDNVSLVKDEHHAVEQCYENSFSKLTHIIVKQVHRKARVGVRNLSQFVCYGKKNFKEVSNCDKLIKVASKKACLKQVRSASSRRKRKRRVWFRSINTSLA
nr:hypothetical protein [Tanacetum cinerariifolium]